VRNFNSYKNNRKGNQRRRAARKNFDLPAGRLVARAPYKNGQKDLAREKQNPGADHGFVKLMIDGRAGGRNINRKPPDMHHEYGD
jgi:hypothetical protein